jgi:hypothetical protein
MKTMIMEWPERAVSFRNYKCMKHCSGVTPEGTDQLGDVFLSHRIKIARRAAFR